MENKKYMCLISENTRGRVSIEKGKVYDYKYLDDRYIFDKLIEYKYIIPLEEWREQIINKILNNE